MFFARTFTTRAVSSALLLPLAFALGCSPYSEPIGPGSLAASKPIAGVHLSGESIVRGLFFGEGRVGKLIPEIWGEKSFVEQASNAEQAIQYRRVEERALAAMRTNDPDLSRFSSVMQSGDRLAIDAAVRSAAGAVLSAFRADPAMSTQLGTADLAPTIDVDTYAFATLVFFVVAFLAILAVAAAAGPKVHGTNPAASAAAMPSLQHDEFVDMLATRLAGSK
jgi:SdpC family antimicrobial peptide